MGDGRKAIYTTNSVESLNGSLRNTMKTRGGFPNEGGLAVASSGSAAGREPAEDLPWGLLKA